MALRDDLDTAIRICLSANSYARRIEELRALHGHSITIAPCENMARFNCYAFATGISALPEYSALVDAHQSSVLLNSDVMRQLVDEDVLRPVAIPAAGGMAIYFAGAHIAHAARVRDGGARLISKWGGNELHEHGVWETPASLWR